MFVKKKDILWLAIIRLKQQLYFRPNDRRAFPKQVNVGNKFSFTKLYINID